MKRFLVPFVLAAFVTAGIAYAADPELKTDDDKTLYALGLVMANQLAAFKLTPTELDIVKAGLTDGIAGKTGKVDLETFGPKIQPLAQQRRAAGAGEEKKKGKEFLDKIAANSKVKKLDGGAMIETVTEGTGASPSPTDNIKANYKGTTIDGKEFDSSAKHGGPQTMNLGQVVKCWQNGFQFMKVGGKAKLYCPSDTAYGDQGRGAQIPPGATLVFDIELVDIVK